MDCRLSGPWGISLNPFFLHDGVLKAKGCAPGWVWVVVFALWGQLKGKFILGYQLSYLSQCRAPGSSCCCKTNHTAGAVSLFSWAFPSPGSHGAVVCTELPWGVLLHCGTTWSGAPAAKAGLCSWGVGMLPWLWSCPVLGCVRAACRAVLGGFASSQICSPGGKKPWLLHRAVGEKLSQVSALWYVLWDSRVLLPLLPCPVPALLLESCLTM